MLLGLNSCFNEQDLVEVNPASPGKILISGDIEQVYKTRANDSGFCDGDQVGIYVVDYNGSTAGTLLSEGNRADNVRHTFNESVYQWESAYDIYWKDNRTNVDIYGYYPFAPVENVNSYPFEVAKDQSTDAEYGQLGGYEASDFLWGKTANVSPTDRVIKLGFKHMMASTRVSLVEGEGFEEGEWAAAEKQVLILNTIRKSVINLATGEVTADGEVPSTGTIPHKYNDDFRAIVIPQTVAAGKGLVSITVDGAAYTFKKDEAMVYNPGKQHNFTITVNKRAAGGGLEFVLSSESITAWENDAVSHDANAREYIVINVEEPGTLEECIAAAGKEIAKVRNLKVTGKITSKDFAVMKYKMEKLSALNLKEVVIVAGEGGSLGEGSGQDYMSNVDDQIPAKAMDHKESLVSLVLPDKLKIISGDAGVDQGSFSFCINLSGSLIIPEGVEEIGPAAFNGCTSLTGTLVLPSTLKKIGKNTGDAAGMGGTFAGCNFVCELILPDILTVIGNGSFAGCKNLYGELRLPDSLKEIGESAFEGCENLVGSLSIPQGITIIPKNCFNGCWMGGTLSLHDGITAIGEGAFANNGFKGELRLPKDLEVVSHNVFYNNDFSGTLVLPEKLYTIGDKSFAYNWRLMGTIEIPENVISIGAGAFAKCRSLEGIIFPEGLESIRYNSAWNEDGGAFQDCFGIGRIVCKGTIPAYIQEGAFHGVAKDNFTLEVPESAIQQYQAAVGWKDFKRISAYRNLAIRPSVATAINTTITRDLVLNADDEWIVESQPDWVTLSATSGTGKTEIKLTFSEMPAGTSYDGTSTLGRKGEIVFKLKDKDYRTRCNVSQYDYEHAEDEIITLQTASKGKGVNLVFLGDGYNAEDVSKGTMLANIKEGVEHYFNIEPYKTYREYFNVYTAVSVSAESGIGSVNTIIYNRFNTTAKGGVSLGGRNGDSDNQMIFEYACKAPTVSQSNINETLIVIIPNTKGYCGICYMWDEGAAIAYCPMSDYGYPEDFRGVIQHEAGGHGFAKLGDEYIYHNVFIDNCICTCCGHVFEFNMAKAKGWYDNLSLSGKMDEVPWSHLIFHEKYSQIVDIFEGGFMHNRGVYRSEQNSCMNNDIPYYSTISRESMVKRIMAIAGETYSFEDFVNNDIIDSGSVEALTKAAEEGQYVRKNVVHHEPVMMGEMPKLNL